MIRDDELAGMEVDRERMIAAADAADSAGPTHHKVEPDPDGGIRYADEAAVMRSAKRMLRIHHETFRKLAE